MIGSKSWPLNPVCYTILASVPIKFLTLEPANLSPHVLHSWKIAEIDTDWSSGREIDEDSGSDEESDNCESMVEPEVDVSASQY